MKAFLLAAGIGSRLRPLTDRIPKCLVPVDGVPLLGLWFRELAGCGVESVLVNTHHLPEAVQEFVGGYDSSGLDISLTYEETLLGSAGTVAANRRFVEGDQDFLVIYADNLTDVSLSDMLRFHRQRQSEFTIGLFQTAEPRECGIATLDGNGLVVGFEEKPANPTSALANAGLYVAGPSLFDIIPDKPYSDFGFDILPGLVGRMHGYVIDGFFCDLGTPQRLARGREEWSRRHRH